MKKKIIVPAFALLIGVGLAGSITGTAAWYQYSTKTNAALVGASGGTAGNLQMRFREDGQARDAGWTTFISKEQMATYLAGKGFGQNIEPVTPGALEKDSALTMESNNPLMYTNPRPGKGPYAKWNKATKANYVVIELQLRYIERDGVKENDYDEKNLERDIYLSDLVLEQPASDAANHKDLSEALRFHVSSYSTEDPTEKTNRLISKNGGTTVTNGKLDIDGDGKNDTARPDANDKYGWNEEVDMTTEIVYGEGQQVSFSNRYDVVENQKYYDEENAEATDAKVYPLIAQPHDTDDYDLKDDSLEYDTGKSKSIGATVEDEEEYLNVDITIWVEGWQKFKSFEDEDDYSSFWDNKYIDSEFRVGFEFGINPKADA